MTPPLRSLVFTALAAIVALGCSKSQPLPSPTSPGSGSEPRELVQTLSQIEQRVVKLRGLQPKHKVDRAFMDRDGLAAFLKEHSSENQQDLINSADVLKVLGLIPEDMDLSSFLQSLLTEQVLGLYDPKTDKMYVIGDPQAFGPLEAITYAHEYTHALQQQHFDFQGKATALEKNKDSEAEAGLTALVEGDAYLFQGQYMLTHLTEKEREEVQSSSNSTPVLDSAPQVLQKLFLWDLEGLNFVALLFKQGGVRAVNAAFSDPPVSTEQVLHIEKYRSHEGPIAVTLPDLTVPLGAGWTLADTDVMGEYFLRTYLETSNDDTIAADAAAGWGGDRYALLKGPNGERVLAALLVWDTEQDAAEFYRVGLKPLADTGNATYLGIKGNQVLLIVAPSQGLIAQVRAQFPGL